MVGTGVNEQVRTCWKHAGPCWKHAGPCWV